MRNKQETLLNYIKRSISNEAVSVRIYIIWGVITLFVFGIFGFYPVIKNLISNAKLVEEMYQNNSSLKNKIAELKTAKEKLDIVGEGADILDIYLPYDFEAQTHMVNLSILTSGAGYSLEKINFGKAGSPEVSMVLSISGKGNLGDLVSKIEESGRLMEVQSIKYSVGEKSDTINMNIVSFIMKR